MKIRTVKIAFPPSKSTDVEKYRMYYVATGTPLDYGSPYIDLPNQLPESDGLLRFDAYALEVFTDGHYDIGITAVDDGQNESEMSLMVNVPFDFIAPDAPGPITIEVV